MSAATHALRTGRAISSARARFVVADAVGATLWGWYAALLGYLGLGIQGQPVEAGGRRGGLPVTDTEDSTRRR